MPSELDIDRIVTAFQTQDLGMGDLLNFATAPAQLDVDHAAYHRGATEESASDVR